jgi:hypothetical protein
MRALLALAATLPLLAMAAAAQDKQGQYKADMKADVDQMLRGAKVIGIEAGIMGPAVKGAPYSADEIHETTQVLADGTRIHNETKTTVYRDSQGRVRRESPGRIMIWDSASGSSYMLNQSNQTGQKMQMNYMVHRTGPGEEPPDPQFKLFHFQPDGVGPELSQRQMVVLRDIDPKGIAEGKAELRVTSAKEPKKETLGSEMLEGVNCEGTRLTNTIEAGAIGNDRPIQTVEERWYSPELQVNLLVKRTDPRTGEDVTRLTNVRRLEPDPSLFTPPPGYQIK